MKASDKTNSIKEFFEKLSELHCITQIWEKVLDLLLELQPEISFEALAVFCIYFSQLDDGNICIPLKQEELIAKWQKKWNGLLLQEKCLDQKEKDFNYFSDIINKGLPQLSTKQLPNLIAESGFSKPFIIDSGWLFATKYYKAKINIENRISLIMKQNTIPSSEDKNNTIRDYFKNLTGSGTQPPMILKNEQTNAIIRGQTENLIITGGPGTGKTTVVCYLLWNLFMTKDILDYALFLVAPSGKAADRMKESISETLSRLNIEKLSAAERDRAHTVFEKLNSAHSSTIHRLLSLNQKTNSFRYNAENQFDKKSIFVIDEASMIDITLFSSLLEAIPEGARVFILGDKEQLPSVQAGAVLGELLAEKTDSVAELKESSRFSDNSDVGRLKNAMQLAEPLKPELAFLTNWNEWKTNHNFENIPQGEFPVTTFIPEKKYKEKETQIKDIIESWKTTFYADIVKKALEISENSELSKLDELWNTANKARILCAERKGLQGTETINNQICKSILREKNLTSENDYFTGQLMMLTKNQSIFCLYNGDSGIIIERNGLKYLMVKKELQTEGIQQNTIQQGIFQKGSYLFYPIHLLPKETIETAYAITIHKSQGSGYKSILIFLPEQKGHPLLNRQIAYTAITRTEGATYIYADYGTLEHARQTIIERDTQIHLN